MFPPLHVINDRSLSYGVNSWCHLSAPITAGPGGGGGGQEARPGASWCVSQHTGVV